ncbi:class I SAM-dependent DNA methyltransferase [Methylobacterium gnaphalii]|uniref:Methyltransferase n=1 Tax=Methylobacterium gnaphalii TaxID=1010610 RepID=A0A512JGV8_9HYPH|nr:SAM-dependent methyltransferase [Methylobacterium gnaphalii]GEP09082.1 methyltransferase [Methylobacterium gnaphalii]GJD68394.1 Ubiquinone biosynthesis O-methyltransferase, mitochondrial [Methylobacterium gnaphalii]GLS49006.1 methyltransferase [Methylobacterium gnaphalii]
MTRHATTLPPSYFDERYAADPDPWRFETSDYEREKYAATLAALPQDRYARALEVGCSIGVLTHQLAGRCETLVGLDVAAAALERARERCRDHAHVDLRLGQVPNDWAEGAFDLILLSEVVYYLDRGDVERLAERVRGSLRDGGSVVLVHWTGETHYPLTGDEAAELFIAASRAYLRIEAQARAEAYRIDVLSRQSR